jgi:hypothetical protein
MKARIALLAGGLLLPPAVFADIERALARLAEEAGAFAGAARKTIGQETLKQRALKPRPRFRFRVGEAARRPIPLEYQNREIVSEYGFTSFNDQPDTLHEIRRVITVDGRDVGAPVEVRETLAFGLASADDRKKKKMLEEFEKRGLIGAVINFGQVLALFEKRHLSNFAFRPEGRQMLGAESALVFSFEQVKGPDSMTIFAGREVLRRKLEGEVWVRESDYLPVRIVLTGEREAGKHVISWHGAVDYGMSRFGVLLPVSVVYREHSEGVTLTENRFEYSDFRQFGAESDLRFEVEPEHR